MTTAFSEIRPKIPICPFEALRADLMPPKFPASKVSPAGPFALLTYEPGP